MTQPSRPLGLVDRIVFPQAIDVRRVWPSEPSDFTPWLAKNLKVLDFLGLGQLTHIDSEVPIPDTGRALDILAEMPTGQKVAIENQYGRADHDHLTRGLAYAVGLAAEALIVIAEEHRGEFRAVADYLNRVAERSTETAIRVYLVELAVELIGEHVVPRFSVVISPNQWIEAVVTSQPKADALTIETFLSALPDELRPTMKSVVEWWNDQPDGSVRYAATSISLDRPNPTKPKSKLSHLLLWTQGTHTIQRGYLREAGIVTDANVSEFDALVHRLFPEATWAEKAYYLNVPGAPSLISVEEFFRWTEQRSRLLSALV